MNQPAKRGKGEERIPGQIVHPPRAADADQGRVEVALMIGNDQHTPCFWDILAAEVANAKKKNPEELQATLQETIPKVLDDSTLGHGRARSGSREFGQRVQRNEFAAPRLDLYGKRR